MLPADRYQLVPPAEVDCCTFCGARSLGADRAFVSIDDGQDGDEGVPAAFIETKVDSPGRRLYRARDAFGRGTSTVEIVKPQVCSECLTMAGRLVALEDSTPHVALADELRAAIAEKDATITAKDARIGELEHALAQVQAFETIRGLPGVQGTPHKRRPREKAAA